MIKRKLILLVLILSAMVAKGEATKDTFNISLNVKGAENSFLTIGYHLGDRQYIKDTIATDANGFGVYSGNEALEQGLYIILFPDNMYFDIIIDTDQIFEISCSKDDIVGSMVVSGSDENTAFIEYQRKWIQMQAESRSLREKMQAGSSDNETNDEIRKAVSDHETKMLDFLKTTAESRPGSFLSLLVKALIPVEVPDIIPSETQGNIDSLRWVAGYNYNVDHFFDNVDLSDSRLVRTPILHGRLKSYFENVVIQHPDTLNRIIPKIVAKSEGDSVMFRYLVVFLFNHFRESQIMGHDGVTVKIIDDYYLSGKADWISEETYKDLSDDANRLRTNLIGKKAVDLIMETFTGQHQSLYDINKDYTILYFWEPNCGHCKTSTPVLKKFYDKFRDTDIEIFAICTQGTREEWENYIIENQLNWINGWDPDRVTHFDFYYNVTATPLVYVLDRNKKIIAKKIAVENLEEFLRNYRRTGR